MFYTHRAGKKNHAFCARIGKPRHGANFSFLQINNVRLSIRSGVKLSHLTSQEFDNILVGWRSEREKQRLEQIHNDFEESHLPSVGLSAVSLCLTLHMCLAVISPYDQAAASLPPCQVFTAISLLATFCKPVQSRSTSQPVLFILGFTGWPRFLLFHSAVPRSDIQRGTFWKKQNKK